MTEKVLMVNRIVIIYIVFLNLANAGDLPPFSKKQLYQELATKTGFTMKELLEAISNQKIATKLINLGYKIDIKIVTNELNRMKKKVKRFAKQ